MTPDELRAQLEEDLTWRMDEIRFFQNIEGKLDELERDQFRRSLILIVYSHFEGFCKLAFTTYSVAITAEQLSCFKADAAIVAATLDEVFKALRNPESKSDFFRDSAPDDGKLHVLAREIEFVQRARSAMRAVVSIPESAVDMESNLKPVVLRKNLFRLGLKLDSLKEHEGSIHKLLNYRNNIAHGSSKAGISAKEYEVLRDAVSSLMNGVLHLVYEAFVGKLYLNARPS